MNSAKLIARATSTTALWYFVASAHSQLISGPMVGHTTPTTAQVWAHAGSGKTVEIVYGRVNAAPAQLITRSMPPRSTNNFTSLIELTGLIPATAYQYEIRVNGIKAEDGSFITAPALNKATKFSYFVASCMHHNIYPEQPAWTAVQTQNPAFNLLIGDNVYANTTDYNGIWRVSMLQRGIPNFATVLTEAPTYATWDDHDYGPNDSDGTAVGKENSLRCFKDLWANPSYGLPGIPGVFYTYYWGNIHFIVMDNRYNRVNEDAPDGPGKTQFGTPQRDWLLAQLKASRSPFKVVCTGGDMMGPYGNEMTTIANYISANNIYGVVFHAGDIHRNEYKQQDRGQGYLTTQITSSGIAKNGDRPWAMIDVDTTQADPVMTARFFEKEVPTTTNSIRLSQLTKAGVNDVILNSPSGGESLNAGSVHSVKWTRVGTGNSNVKLEYSTGAGWKPIVNSVANTGSFNWTVPAENSSTVKLRVSSLDGLITDESVEFFTIGPADPNPLPPSNQVLNPSFEIGGNAPLFWNLSSSAVGSNATAQDGASSLRIEKVGASGNTTQTISTQVGKVYNISAWINAIGITAGKAVFDTSDIYDGIGQGQFVISTANTGWTKYSGSFTATHASVTLRMFTDTNFRGVVYFDNILLERINDPPVAESQSVTTAENVAKAITLNANDFDGDPLSYSVVNSPANGTLSGIAPNLTYTPTPNYKGLDSFTFRVNDGIVYSPTVTVSIQVNPAAPTNLVVNPSFEAGGSAPTSWTRASSAVGSTASAQDGSNSLRIAMAGINNPTTQTIPIQSGKTYNLTVWIHAADMTSGNAVFDTNDQYDGPGQGQFVISSANSGWTKYSGSFTANTAFIMLRMFTGSSFAGTVYFDNITLSEELADPFTSWIDGFYQGSSNPAIHGFRADPDNDGLANGLEFTLGGNPSISDSSNIMPTGVKTGDNYVYTFKRSDASENGTVQVVQYASNPGAWTDIMIAATSGVSGGASYTVSEGTPATNPDSIVVTVPHNGDRLFVRLKVVQQ
jgi:alkaline phosphatase D